jgi:transcriptional regulator with PAS, ATPase and Fis domain
MRHIMRLAERVGRSRGPVLITGETGTGKELVARAIHGTNPAAPFVPIDCSVLVESLVETELYGYARGAFTGAASPKAGLIEIAAGGTAFFDEIGELPLSSQSKLLRVLQEWEFRPVGSLAVRRADFRMIAATNRDLARDVQAGRFRRDLYYRLNAMHLHIPPLRERKEDIPALVDFFLERYGGTRTLTPQLLEAMLSYDWPGNVRELENCIRCHVEIDCCAFQGTGDVRCSLYDHCNQCTTGVAGSAPGQIHNDSGAELQSGAALITVAEAEKRTILNALRHAEGDRAFAASLLGIGKSTLYRKLKAYAVLDVGERPRVPRPKPLQKVADISLDGTVPKNSTRGWA